MAQVPITTFSHNTLAPYDGEEQKFVDAKLLGQLLDLIDVDKIIEVDFVSGCEGVIPSSGTIALVIAPGTLKVVEYREVMPGTYTPVDIWDRITNSGNTLIRSTNGNIFVKDTVVYTATGTVAVLVEIATGQHFKMTDKSTLIPVKAKWSVISVGDGAAVLYLTQLPQAGILLIPLAKYTQVTGDYISTEIKVSSSKPTTTFGVEAQTVRNTQVKGLVYIPWHQTAFVAVQYYARQTQEAGQYGSFSALLSKTKLGVSTSKFGVAVNDAANVIGVSFDDPTTANPVPSALVFSDEDFTTTDTNSHMPFITTIQKVGKEATSGKGTYLEILVQGGESSSSRKGITDMYILPCV